MKPIVQHSPQFLRKRKSLLVYPLLVIPFMLIAFVSLGGGKGQLEDHQGSGTGHGFNMKLPDAHFAKNETLMDKMGFYQRADEDSIKLMEKIGQDPYHAKLTRLSAPKPAASLHGFGEASAGGSNPLITDLNGLPPVDSQADQLLKKLEELKKKIHQPVQPSGSEPFQAGAYAAALPFQSPDVNRLGKLMQSVKTPDSPATADPQMEKLNGMLDKIIRIEHPGQEQDTGRLDRVAPFQAPKLQIKKEAATVEEMAGGGIAVDSALPVADQAFFSIEDKIVAEEPQANMISAVVQEDQTLVAGGTLMLRLTEDAVVNGISIPRDNLLYGKSSLSGDRITVAINSIRIKGSEYTVSLEVYGLDGLPGIRIQDALTRDVLKESANESVGSIGLTTLDPSMGAQAATAGVQAAKTLLSRKLRLVRVSVPAGYEVFLKNTKASH